MKGLSQDVELYIIGGSPTQEYLKIVNSLKLKNIIFLEFQQKKQLFEYLKSADIFVLPTREDIWGLVIIEALACGLPVITTNNCVAGRELIKDNYNGFIVPINDELVLNKKIDFLTSTTNLYKFSQNALKSVENYSIERMAEEHFRIFNEIKRKNDEK